jgi:uncharacterized protein YecE (DUF72 family)
VPHWLAEHGLDLVAVDVPPLPGLYPSGWVHSGPRVYVRLHSRNASNWYKGDKERYDYKYTDATLGEWVAAARNAVDVQETLFLFNNCYRSQAPNNARRLQSLFGQQAPQANVIKPSAAQHPMQRSLFE